MTRTLPAPALVVVGAVLLGLALVVAGAIGRRVHLGAARGEAT